MNHRDELPTGTVTFLFTDIEGSTRLLQRIGDRYPTVLARHHQLLRGAFARHSGTVVGTEGDSFFVVFPAAAEALAAAVDAQLAIGTQPWPADAEVRVRIGLHTGDGTLGGDSYVGIDVHRAARIAAAGHGGQIVLSGSTHALVEHELPPGVQLRNLGEHRLKDLLAPDHLWDVVHPHLPGDFPPLRTLTVRPNNLPLQMSAFLGREQELAAIRDVLSDDVRLLTLTGPGGIGKTRLALQAAAEQAERWRDGVFFIELATVRDPDGVFDAIAQAVGVSEPSDESPLDAVCRHLAGQQVLLVLDNVEQVVDAADGIAQLMRRCPNPRVLVTSRAALNVRGEHIFTVPPLAVPSGGIRHMSAGVAAGYEAVRLFVERARQVRPDFTLTDENATAVADICARLDGLPLAIELAAARVKLFSPHDLRQRLHRRLELLRGGPRDLPARQQTLRDAIAWSYELLDADERSVFRLLSLFSTARPEAVEAVASRLEPLLDVDIVDQLTSLVDKSLVRSVDDASSVRLSMLQTIREYAAERLTEKPDFSSAAGKAHAEHFSGLARALQPRLGGAGSNEALTELAVEVGNLRSAWEFWLDAGDLRELDAMFEPLWLLHDARGWYGAAVELAQDLLAVLTAVPSTQDRVEQKALLSASIARGLMAIRGYTEEVDDAYRQALALMAAAGGLPQLFPALRSLASLHLYRAEFDKGMAIGRQLLELAERQLDKQLLVEAHLVLGINIVSLGDSPTGLDHLEQAIALFDQRQASGFRLGASPGAVARTTSALVLWPLGFPDRAIRRANEALALARALNHPFTLAYTLYHVGFLAFWQGEFELVHAHAAGALQVAEEHGYEIWRALAMVLQGVAMAGLGQATEGLARSEQGFSLYQGLDSPPVFWPPLLSVRVRTLALAGRPGDALGFVDEAIDQFGGQVNFLYPEMPLLKGDLLAATSGPESPERWYQEALETARTAGTRMTELRAATRLTRLRRAGGAEPAGVEQLRAVYDTFTEGWDTKDLADARTLLSH